MDRQALLRLLDMYTTLFRSQCVEMSIFVRQQLGGRVKLGDAAMVEYQDPIIVND